MFLRIEYFCLASLEALAGEIAALGAVVIVQVRVTAATWVVLAPVLPGSSKL